MLTRYKRLLFVAVVLFAVSASADPLAYVITLNQQFGTVDLVNGTFQQIGPNLPEGVDGLAPGPNGSLLTLTFSGNLASINPVTGVTTVIGPTGLADCTTPASPCGPTSVNVLAGLGGTLYATDLSNHLYTVNPATGATKLIGPTGVPAVPFNPTHPNPDGTLNVFEESLFGADGKLYATFDTNILDPSSGQPTPVMANHLYQIDPLTGLTTLVGPTAQTLSAVAEVNGLFYAFIGGGTQQIVTLDLANGNTRFVSDLDPAVAPLILGASPVPEPASIALAAFGIAGLIVYRRRKRLDQIAPPLPSGR